MSAGDRKATVWVSLQTSELPNDASCKAFSRADQAHIWHAWNDRARYCEYHHLGGLKAPVERVVKNRQKRESARRQAP